MSCSCVRCDVHAKVRAVSNGPEHVVIFLPFLRIKSGECVAGVEFLPLRDADGNTPEPLATAREPLTTILSGYIDRHGKPFDNCVVATIPGRGWDLTPDDLDTVHWAATLLFLASWACNEHFPTFSGAYVNASAFRPVGQGYSGDLPTWIAVVARRRDGERWDGGYEHGDFKFNIPVQCSINGAVDVDGALLAALDAACTKDSLTIARLRSALPYAQLANTDDSLMQLNAEAILMASAFEQILGGPSSAYGLGRKFGALFKACGSVTVAEARQARPGIEIDTSAPERAEAQPRWWAHRKWLEELYDVRSKAVHKGHHRERTWGWQIHEHLVMAAHAFPLTVKKLLERDGDYALTDEDRARCRAMDKLLAATAWHAANDATDRASTWHKILSKERLDIDRQARTAAYQNGPLLKAMFEGADAPGDA